MDLGPCKGAGLGAHMQLLTQLLYCLAHMLRQPYPCPVPLPGQALLGLAGSVLQIQPAGAYLLAELCDCVVAAGQFSGIACWYQETQKCSVASCMWMTLPHRSPCSVPATLL